MKKWFALVLFLAAASAPFVLLTPAEADKGMPPNNRARGLVYDGLEIAKDGTCKGAFKLKGVGNTRTNCTHGPDPAPANMNVAYAVAPLQSPSLTTSTSATVTCDGDGVSGKRVQVIYAHASDVPDQYAAYLASFQQWAADADAIFQNSAAETGGTRHVRFVHDANCAPSIATATLSPTGDDTFANSNGEIYYLGFNSSDRDYLIFMDAHIYCGISGMETDDQAGAANRNNLAPHYSRVDAGCWSGDIAAHELMHAFGGVQGTAPHSTGEGHCYDQSDLMCRPTNGIATQDICPYLGYQRFDCNHDDYYHTSPPAGSYLASHWNVANSIFLIGAQPAARISSLVTGRLRGNNFVATDSFKVRDTVVVRAQVVDDRGAVVAGATVTLAINRPDGLAQCVVNAVSDNSGIAQASCATSNSVPRGSWDAHLNGISANGFSADLNGSARDHGFTVQ